MARDRTLSALEREEELRLGLAFGDRVQTEIDLLLAERDEALNAANRVELPVRVPASRFKDFVSDLPALIERYRRPMPQKPYKQTRAGTLFHSWVEARYGAEASLTAGPAGARGWHAVIRLPLERHDG